MKILKWFKTAWLKFRSGWNNLDDKVKKVAEISVKVCEEIKKSTENGVFDTLSMIIDSVIPGDQQPIFKLLKNYLVKNLPKIIIELKLVGSISGLNNPEEEMKAIIAQFKILNNDQMNAALQEISAYIIDAFSDGELSKEERKYIVDYAVENFLKHK